MIVVRIELWSAITRKVTPLGTMVITNRGSGTAKRGDYDVVVARKSDASDLAKVMAKPLRRGEVLDYPRLSYNVWRLVSRAVLSAFPEERS